MTERRLRLWADPGRLTGFNPDTAWRAAGLRLRELGYDVELTHIERLPDSVGVILLVGPSVTAADLDEIAAALRETLDIGAGSDALLPEDEGGAVRGMPSAGRRCSLCELPDGRHVPGCPNERR
jgi:hypothetical protein